MKIRELLDQRMTFSFEVFPPKADKPIEPLLETLEHLYKFKPDFISCTYGAGGSNKGRNVEVCAAIKRSGKSEVLTHFTCIGNFRDEIKTYLAECVDYGLENVLALRGDLPENWESTGGDFSHADGLLAYIKELYPQLCIGAACYPEKHIQAPSFDADISHIRSKQDNGAEYLISQLGYDLDAFRRYEARLRQARVELPIIVGVMPVLSKDSIIRMTLSNGCSIPRELAALMGKYGDNPEDFRKAGKEYTVELLYRYVSAGISGLHIYTMNRYEDVAEILNMSGIRRDA